MSVIRLCYRDHLQRQYHSRSSGGGVALVSFHRRPQLLSESPCSTAQLKKKKLKKKQNNLKLERFLRFLTKNNHSSSTTAGPVGSSSGVEVSLRHTCNSNGIHLEVVVGCGGGEASSLPGFDNRDALIHLGFCGRDFSPFCHRI